MYSGRHSTKFRAVTQEGGRRYLTEDTQVLSHVSPCGIPGGQIPLGRVFQRLL